MNHFNGFHCLNEQDFKAILRRAKLAAGFWGFCLGLVAALAASLLF